MIFDLLSLMLLRVLQHRCPVYFACLFQLVLIWLPVKQSLKTANLVTSLQFSRCRLQEFIFNRAEC